MQVIKVPTVPDYLFTPLTAVSLLATAISLTIAAMLWRRRTAPGALALTVLELAAAVWSFAFAFDAAATSSQLKLFWSQIEYPGITVAPLAFHIFAFQFSQKGGHISWRRIAWLAVVPGLTIVLAWTNFGHGLVWRGVVIDPTTNLGIYDHGPWFWLFAAYAWALLLTAVSLLFGMLRDPAPLHRRQTKLAVVAALLPLIANLVYLAGRGPVPGLDWTPLSFSLTGILVGWNILRQKMLGLVPIARSRLIEELRDAVLVLDADHRVIDFNPAAQKLLQRLSAPEPLLGTIVGPRFMDLGFELDNLEDQAEVNFEIDGEMLSFELQCSPVHDQRGRCCGRLVVLRDLTERRAFEGEQRQTLARVRRHESAVVSLATNRVALQAGLEAVVKAATERAAEATETERVGVWLFSEGRRQLRCLDLYERSLGRHSSGVVLRAADYPRYFDALVSGRAVDAHDARCDPRTEEFARGFLEPQGITSMLDAAIRVSGELVGVVCHEHVGPVRRWKDDEVAFAGQVADQVAQALSEQERRRAEARFRTMVEEAVVGLFECSPEGIVLEANPAFVALLGYADVDKVKGISLTGSSCVPWGQDRLLEVIDAAGLANIPEVDWIRQDGATVRVRLRGRAVRGERGNVTRFEMIAEDVTEQRRLREQLQHAQKIEAVGRLAGGVAHDFNNLLTAMGGYAELILRLLPEGDPSRLHAEGILRAAKQASHLTRQLLTFSRRDVIQPRTLDLNEVVQSASTMLARLIGENILLELDFEDEIALVRADPSQIEQVLLNLAVNARDSMPDGGRLVFSTRNLDFDERQARQHVGLEAGPHVLLEVADTGSGMDDTTLSCLFEPFFTTKEDGSGLGLSIVHGIVTQSGGAVAVSSEKHRGTTFAIFLPARQGASAPARVETLELVEREGSERILVVEDEEVVREFIVTTLKQHGFSVLDASNAEEARSLLSEPAGSEVDLLLTDVVMPGTAGDDLARAVSDLRPAIRVLLMSGYSSVLAGQASIVERADFLPKPFSTDALVAKVREILDRD